MKNEGPKDYVHVIGARSGYSREAFTEEAKQLGISRLLPAIPNDLIPGKSRVYCIYDAKRDTYPRSCPNCGQAMPSLEPPYPDKVRCPNEFIDENGAPAPCGYIADTSRAAAGSIIDYFVPETVEVVVRAQDNHVKAAVEMFAAFQKDIGVKLDTGPELLRGRFSAITQEGMASLAKLAKMKGIELDVELLAKAVEKGQTIVVASREPKRLCGYRKNMGQYIVAQKGKGKNPLIQLPQAVTYKGQSFRGIKALPAAEAEALRAWTDRKGRAVAEVTGEVEETVDVAD